MGNTSSWITREARVSWRSSCHLTDKAIKAPRGTWLLWGWEEGLEPVSVPAHWIPLSLAGGGKYFLMLAPWVSFESVYIKV